MQNYENAPAMISTKDLDYLSDIYNWNFNASKVACHFKENVTDEEIKDLLKRVSEMHKEHCKTVLNILS